MTGIPAVRDIDVVWKALDIHKGRSQNDDSVFIDCHNISLPFLSFSGAFSHTSIILYKRRELPICAGHMLSIIGRIEEAVNPLRQSGIHTDIHGLALHPLTDAIFLQKLIPKCRIIQCTLQIFQALI